MAGWQEPTVIEPTEEPQCKNCTFWSPLKKPREHTNEAYLHQEAQGFGACHRYPPPRPPKLPSITSAAVVTPGVWWCGEHRPC